MMILADNFVCRGKVYLTHIIAILSLTALIPFCKSSPQLFELQGQALGAAFHIKYRASDKRFNSARLKPETTATDIQNIFIDIQNQTSLYQPDSELIRVNHHAHKEWIILSDALGVMISYALDLSKKSDGYYDITTGALSKLWAIDDITRANYQPPSAAEIVQSRSLVGYQNLQIKKTSQGYLLLKKIPGIKIDLASISAGYAADQIAHYFELHQVKNYLIDISGEVRSGGTNQGKRWIIGIENPAGSNFGHADYVKKIKLENQSLATSGVSKNFAQSNHQRYSHIIDPHTGYPTVSRLLSVTVIQKTAMEADAVATAIFAMGDERGNLFAEKYSIPVLMVLASKNSEVIVKMNDSMKKFVLE